MDFSSLIPLLSIASKSKTAEKAQNQLLEGLWNWIRPYLIEDVPALETAPPSEETTPQLEARLKQLVEEDPAFLAELLARLEQVEQADIIEKNIVRKSIEGVKRIKIGDKEYNPEEKYTRKNIVEGDVKDADEFTLGDGH